jgi:hypothetical protein
VKLCDNLFFNDRKEDKLDSMNMYVIVKYAGEPFVNKEMYVSIEHVSSRIRSVNTKNVCLEERKKTNYLRFISIHPLLLFIICSLY